jgi:membrane-associated phospholipid phosphatase
LGSGFGLCVFLTIASKFAFYLIGGKQPNSLILRSPSGHVAIATGFYGCCALMLTAGRGQAERVLICIGTVMLVGMLAATRIMLGLHTGPEIAVGFAIGAFSLVVFGIHLSGGQPIMLKAGQALSSRGATLVATRVNRVALSQTREDIKHSDQFEQRCARYVTIGGERMHCHNV